jgi:hypothetical protein
MGTTYRGCAFRNAMKGGEHGKARRQGRSGDGRGIGDRRGDGQVFSRRGKMRVVKQDPEQLRYCHRRMGVVQLDGGLLRKRIPISVAVPEAPYEIGQRAGDQKILLNKAQCLSHAGGVVGIQHPSQGFGCQSAGQRSDKIATAECLKVEIVGAAAAHRRSVLMVLPP